MTETFTVSRCCFNCKHALWALGGKGLDDGYGGEVDGLCEWSLEKLLPGSFKKRNFEFIKEKPPLSKNLVHVDCNAWEPKE